jgi:hypothetical protein
VNKGPNVVIERITTSDLDDVSVRFDRLGDTGGRGGTFENGRVTFERVYGSASGEPGYVRSGLLDNLVSTRTGVMVAAVVAVGLLLAFFGTIYYVLPSSSVLISPRVQGIPVDVEIRIDPDAGSVDLRQRIIPALVTEVVVEESLTKPTTGRRREPSSFAEGLVTIRNRTEKALDLPMGSRVTSSDGVGFLTKAPVLVPATLKVGGINIPGEAIVGVTAEFPGLSGNAPQLTITEVAGPMGSKLEAFNPQPLRGGSEREVSLVTQRDLDELSSILRERLQSAAIERLRRQRETDQALVVWSAAAGNPQVLKESFSASLDDRADKVTLTMAIRAQGTMFSVADAETVIQELIKSDPNHRGVDVDSIDIRSQKVSAENQGRMDLQFAAVGKVIDEIDVGQVRNLVSGHMLSEGMSALRALPGVKDVEVMHDPPGTENFPRLGFRIDVKIKADRPEQQV